jgi:2-polyprenyl-3-methyl-5-hydroxy-6-metoxy-1,4-benzoquinol methylase|tara:strand:+ start:32 stop:1231 length:1200 start_codon:yes stop_codon:yes gene_type:complete
MKCKITGADLKPFMSFGKMPSANGFLGRENFDKEFFYEMEVGFSSKVSLLQLNEFSNPKKVHNEKYPFYTSSSEYMKLHFNKFSEWMKKEYLSTNSKLIEVGSNDGTLLKNFINTNIDYVGFEPSKTIADLASAQKIKTLNSFFNQESINEIKEYKNNTDVICSANVIAHIPDLKDVILTIDKLLSSKGVFIFEDPYLGSMFSQVSYDQIYDEHIFLFSLSSIKKIFALFDFELIDALPQKSHGGSMRYVIARKNKHKINTRVHDNLALEQKNKLDDMEACLNFKKDCEKSKELIVSKLKKFKENGKKICGYAATAKSTTLLNYCDLGTEIFDFICDTTAEKIGKFSPGKHIPIVPIEHFKKNKPDIAYLFAWNHKEEIFSKEKDFNKSGGKWFSHVSL